MRRLGFGLLYAIAGYFAGAVGGYFLIEGVSSNTHDRSMEAGMTGAFVLGPLAAFIGLVVGVVRGGRKASPVNGPTGPNRM